MNMKARVSRIKIDYVYPGNGQADAHSALLLYLKKRTGYHSGGGVHNDLSQWLVGLDE
jgi:tetrahydromethanopterin S-methyltransferase subunit H